MRTTSSSEPGLMPLKAKETPGELRLVYAIIFRIDGQPKLQEARSSRSRAAASAAVH